MSHVSYGTPRVIRPALHVYYCRYIARTGVALSRGYRSLVSTAFGVKKIEENGGIDHPGNRSCGNIQHCSVLLRRAYRRAYLGLTGKACSPQVPPPPPAACPPPHLNLHPPLSQPHLRTRTRGQERLNASHSRETQTRAYCRRLECRVTALKGERKFLRQERQTLRVAVHDTFKGTAAKEKERAGRQRTAATQVRVSTGGKSGVRCLPDVCFFFFFFSFAGTETANGRGREDPSASEWKHSLCVAVDRQVELSPSHLSNCR